MVKINFTEKEIELLKYERYHHSHPRVQRKMEALLKSHKIPHNKIAKLTGIYPNTLCNYLKDYQTGDLDKLKEVNFYKPKSELVKYQIRKIFS